MGVRYEWANDDHTIMNLYLESPWTWKEYHAVVEVIMPMLRDAGHPCATVMEVSKIGSIPRDGNFIQTLLSVDKTMPENIFASVIVGAPHIVMLFMNILIRLRPHAKRLALFAPTMEEAQAKIRERSQKLYSKSHKYI